MKFVWVVLVGERGEGYIIDRHQAYATEDAATKRAWELAAEMQAFPTDLEGRWETREGVDYIVVDVIVVVDPLAFPGDAAARRRPR